MDVIKLPKPAPHAAAPETTEKAEETAPDVQNENVQNEVETNVAPAEVEDNGLSEAQSAQSVVSAKPDEDAEILKQIEEVKAQQTPVSNDDEQLLDEIKKLLEEFNTESD